MPWSLARSPWIPSRQPTQIPSRHNTSPLLFSVKSQSSNSKHPSALTSVVCEDQILADRFNFPQWSIGHVDKEWAGDVISLCWSMTSDSIASDFSSMRQKEIREVFFFLRCRHQELKNITQKVAYWWLSPSLGAFCVTSPRAELHPCGTSLSLPQCCNWELPNWDHRWHQVLTHQ